MEIIVEIVLQVLGWILQFFGELLIEIFGNLIGDALGHFFSNRIRRRQPVSPWLAAAGYVMLGALLGGLSLWIVPEQFIRIAWLRVANLLFAPIVAGLMMAWIGSWRRQRDREVVRLESFGYGFLFAFSMALVRLVWGH